MKTLLLRHGLIALTACAAACVPSTFNDLTEKKTADGSSGGLHAADPNKIDPTVQPPRPTSPLSTSYVNTDLPHLKWSLPAGTTGATIELAQTRDFANVVHKYVATGSDFVVPDKLDLGPWFWRLTGRSDTNPGQNQSPVWVVYVRGPGALGASETPHMGVLDVDGNGHPDLAVMTVGKGGDDDDGEDDDSDNEPLPTAWVTVADDKDTFAPYSESAIPWPINSNAPILAPVDVNGDGYGDMMIADVAIGDPNAPTSPPLGEIYPFIGGANGADDNQGDGSSGPMQQPFSIMPALAAGDFNGDGFGDVSVAFSNYGAAMLGSGGTAGAMMPFVSAAQIPDAETSAAPAIASSDFNNDGINDIAYAPFTTISPIQFDTGGMLRFDKPTTLALATTTTPTRASAIGAGDFDGDGIDDIAFTTTLAGKAAVCIHGATDGTVNDKACWTSTTTDAVTDFGIALLAADLDGTDGKDELIIVSKSGLIALSHTGTGKGFTSDDSVFTATPLVPAVKPATATGVTVIYPGRPGPARWAAYNTDGKTFDVYAGTTSVQHVDLSVDPAFISLGGTIR